MHDNLNNGAWNFESYTVIFKDVFVSLVLQFNLNNRWEIIPMHTLDMSLKIALAIAAIVAQIARKRRLVCVRENVSLHVSPVLDHFRTVTTLIAAIVHHEQIIHVARDTVTKVRAGLLYYRLSETVVLPEVNISVTNIFQKMPGFMFLLMVLIQCAIIYLQIKKMLLLI